MIYTPNTKPRYFRLALAQYHGADDNYYQKLGENAPGIDDPHNSIVNQPTEITCNETQCCPDNHSRGHRREDHHQRNTCPADNSAEDVPAQGIRPHQVLGTSFLKPEGGYMALQDISPDGIVGVQQRRKDSREDQKSDDEEGNYGVTPHEIQRSAQNAENGPPGALCCCLCSFCLTPDGDGAVPICT